MSILQAVMTAPLMSGESGPPPFEPIDSLQSLGITWTVEVVADLTFVQAWAVLWGNESYNAGLGHFAYFGSTTTLNVGSPSSQNEYTVPDLGTRAHWVFTHTNGGGVSVYRNGVLLTPSATNYIQSSVATNTLLWGGRHNNDGIGFTDTLPGNYLYTNIRTTALDAAGVVSAYNALSGTYGFTPIPTYTITPAANNVDEGSSLEFTIGGTNITNGTYYWTVSGNGPFDAPNGPFTITDNAGSITVTIQANQNTDGAKTFTLSIRSFDIYGTVLATSDSITVNDTSLTPPTYTLTPAANNIDEGSSLEFTIGGTNITDGNYLWVIETGAEDFTTTSGSVTVTGNSGTFSVTPTADSITEGSGTFTVSLRTGSLDPNLVTSESVTINDTSLDPPVPPFSLEFVESQGDYVEVAASSDFNLGTTWTIEFWLRANASSLGAGGGIWGLLNQGGWGATNSIVVALSDAKLVFLSVANNSNDDVRYTEPTSGQWTHVAIVNDAGTQKVWYNGSEQTRVSGNVGTASYTNGTDPLRIGRLSPPNGGTLDGRMALIRISNTAKYSTAFTPSTTYGVTAQVGSSIVIATGDAWGSSVVAIARNTTLGSTYLPGGTITFADGEVRTITQIDVYPSGTDIYWNTAKTGTIFPITLKTANYSEADTVLFLDSDTPLTDASASAHTITNNGVTESTNFPT